MSEAAIVSSYAHCQDAVAAVKRGASRYLTNFFAERSKVETWIANGDLGIFSLGEACIFAREDRFFTHLYFCAGSQDGLARILGAYTSGINRTLTVDLLGSADQVRELGRYFADHGFSDYANLKRMAKVCARNQYGNTSKEEDVSFALECDAARIQAMMEEAFDPLKENLPYETEVLMAIQDQQVLSVKDGRSVRGILFFENVGMSSTLRYWLVAPEARDGGVGGRLIREYFRTSPEARRFLLWVLDDNEGAIRKYEHYGYKVDGLCDRVMVRKAEGAVQGKPTID